MNQSTNSCLRVLPLISSRSAKFLFAALIGFFTCGGRLLIAQAIYTPFVFSTRSIAGVNMTFASAMSVDTKGNIYIMNRVLYKISPDGTVSTIPVPTIIPRSITVDVTGNIYTIEPLNAVQDIIIKISPTGTVTTLATFTNTQGIQSLAVDSAGNVYCASPQYHVIWQVAPGSAPTIYAGQSGLPGRTDGPVSSALLYLPSAVATDDAGNVYVIDGGNNNIRKITPGRVVSSLSGAGLPFYADGQGTSARMAPSGVAVDSKGNVYVAEANNATVRMISPSGLVTTIAGINHVMGHSDGVGQAALFSRPEFIAVDPSGNIVVADTTLSTVRTGFLAPPLVITAQAFSQSVNVGDKVTFSISATGAGPLTYQWKLNGKPVNGATFSSFTIASAQLLDVGNYTVVVTNGGQTVTSDPVVLAVNTPLPPPSILVQPAPQQIAAGEAFQFSVSASNATSYQWTKNGVPLPGATGSILSISNAQATDAGTYQVIVNGVSGSILSNAVTLTVKAISPLRLINISTRCSVVTSQGVEIVGFIIEGSAPKRLLIRASGPALAQYGVSGVLADPVLTLYSGPAAIAENDDWSTDAANVLAASTSSGAIPFAQGSKDSALVVSLQPGGYTAIVRGKDNGTGVALAEVFEADGTSSPSKLINISTRSQVFTADGVQIAGFIISGSSPKKILIRVGGPSLKQYGITDVLADPILTLFSGSTQIGQNDDWGTDSSTVSAFTAAAGAVPFAQGSKDSALAVSLSPGAYTAVVSGKNNTTGNVLTELFEVP